ncbi:DNA primase [Flavobacterium taihuense]|uniref:DNA primase n=1 Tax=Flavobacterium taihuense TaxID=2857508 RepID=A0ABS6XZZ2_9FLAO|nr:DNA primase [Flavobacterium taihuense]MBW4361861.1 DNA primase [Flavobacterium taihuense]
MKRVIVDYAKLTNEILNLLVEKFPDGYDDSDIIRFRNAKNELIEAVEVRTEDTIYLVKVSTKLADRIGNFDEDDEIDDVVEPISGLELDVDDAEDDDDDDDNLDKPDVDGDDDDEDADDKDIADDEDDEDDED